MHGSVRGELEVLLAAKLSAAAESVASHVANCSECASEVEAMRVQSGMLKNLRLPETVEPTAGFYARVMQRIEESAKRSIWWVFVYSPVGKRLAYASLALSLVLGSYVLAEENGDGHLTARPVTFKAEKASGHFDAVVTGSADEQRAAVLANFVSHSSAEEIATLQ